MLISIILMKKIFSIYYSKKTRKIIYDCECRKNAKEDVLWTGVNYNIEEFPKFMNILLDMSYSDFLKYKENIFKVSGDKIILNLNI